ncbi:voltage dependent anion channel 2 [Perilla frutescens var. hirtella]|uniref:Voltage-dependent anion-selective channel protein n=1 Tax=Perilla frutescens var. hirtella TaxID=608512 RepID=A0AAD4IV82_PERFH|nr:voltage dependent anion channel 2 [Perilla frutescens var. hirtella]
MSGPGLFSAFGNKAKEILIKDYSDDQKLIITSESDTGLAIGSTLVKKGGLSSGDVAAKFAFRNGAAIDVKFDTESNISTTLVLAHILPSSRTIASCKFPDYNSGKIEVQYFHDHASLTTAVGLNKSPALDVSATIGTPSVAFGTEASYMVSSGNFAKYNAGFSLKTPTACVSAILFDKGDAVRVSYLRYLDQLNKGAAVGEIARKFSTNENTLTVGCSYAVDLHTMVKAKLDNHGLLAALVQHELKPKSLLTISGSFDTLAMEKTPRFGLALSLKP